MKMKLDKILSRRGGWSVEIEDQSAVQELRLRGATPSAAVVVPVPVHRPASPSPIERRGR
jgi:hypothetical protein